MTESRDVGRYHWMTVDAWDRALDEYAEYADRVATVRFVERIAAGVPHLWIEFRDAEGTALGAADESHVCPPDCPDGGG